MSRTRSALALGGVAVMTACLAPAAVADQGQPRTVSDKGAHGASQGHGAKPGAATGARSEGRTTPGTRGKKASPGQARGGRPAGSPGGSQAHHGASHGQSHGQSHSQSHGQSHGQSHSQSAAQSKGGPQRGSGSGRGQGHQAAPGRSGDPSGNNGTVKISRLGEADGIPNNVPHPGCAFQVEWYGFDSGSDVVSTVRFTPQAPTSDVSLTVDGPTSVPVGGDAASGAGTATGLDAVATYRLSFDGAPHARQGYHVRLTVTTPRSRGNDTKTKVFWVEPCTSAAAPSAVAAAGSSGAGSTASGSAASGSASAADGSPSTGASSTWAQAADGSSGQADDSAGATSSASGTSGADRGSAQVPVAVDAGAQGLDRLVRSPLGLGLTLAGVLLAGVALTLRMRRRA